MKKKGRTTEKKVWGPGNHGEKKAQSFSREMSELIIGGLKSREEKKTKRGKRER